MTGDILERFSPATREWFRGSFSAPTPAQAGAWEAISSGQHALIVAPTGSGKTLSAFLWALDRLAREPAPAEPLRRCRVLYVSPMKALAVDVERNLRSPLVGIGHAAERLGMPRPQITVGVRSGDTPAGERRAFARTPTDVLITTPESLFLMLTSSVREALRGVETVIIDEVHAVAGTKRGSHLAVSLDRLDALLPQPAQRVGLSATVRPVEDVARFLTGGRPAQIVQPPSTKQWDLSVVVPVQDLTALDESATDPDQPQQRASIWPHVEERVVDLIAGHRSTLVFVNSRRLSERLTARLNEIWAERLANSVVAPADSDGMGRSAPTALSSSNARTPAQVMAQSGTSRGAAPVLAAAHHGSVSKEQRQQIEEALKAGTLPAVVATSSLELGIDMGSVDLVIQVEAPPSVASGLQRVGRAGHQVGAVSHGVVFPKFRGDLIASAVVTEAMRAGAIEALRVPANPLDVLAQHIVAMCALEDWSVDDLYALLRRAAPFAGLTRATLDAVLDMLAGKYPSEEFAELRSRIVWDRLTDTLSGRRGAQRLAVTSGGTIPDRGLYAVFLATGEGPGRRVGELDEEMVYESRVGDTFTLGTSTWRIEDITHDRVLVTPAPGLPGRLPFWLGDQQGRPAELGRAIGTFVREVSAATPTKAAQRVGAAGLDQWASDNLLAYLREQREATGHIPTDQTIVAEQFRDELGDWRLAIHSPYGGAVHAPWSLALAARLRERYGVEVQAAHGDDGIVLRLPDVWDEDSGTGLNAAELLDLIAVDPAEINALVTNELGGSAVFAARFRECAARALLLPRRRPDQRQALWQQRQRAAQLLAVASQYPTFPIVLETVRECLQDVFDVPSLTDLMTRIAAGEVSLVHVETSQPSPFARSLLFGYVAQYLYEGDSPLAERRAAALSLDPALLSELLGDTAGLSLRDLLDAEQVARTTAELQRLVPERAARDADDVIDLLRALGPLPTDTIAERTTQAERAHTGAWLVELESSRQVIRVRIAGQERWAAIEDAARLRDALGVQLPVGIPATFLEPVSDPLGDLLSRYARTHGPFTAQALAHWYGVGVAVAVDAARRLVGTGRLVEGEFTPATLLTAAAGTEFCDAEVLRLLRRRSLAALRAEVEPVTARDYAAFLPSWQGVGGSLRGAAGLIRAVEQLCGARIPASAVESLVLPARISDYSPALLDEALSSGEVLWQGAGTLAGDDGWVTLHLADGAPLTMQPPRPPDSPEAQEVLHALSGGGGYFFRTVLDALEATNEADVATWLWDLVWAGHVTNDTFAPLRALLSHGRSAHRRAPRAPRSRNYGRQRGALGSFAAGSAALRVPRIAAPATTVGRWAVLPPVEVDPTVRAYADAEVLLDRYGVLTRGSVGAEGSPGGFAALYRVLSAAEEAGRVRRGYFIEGLGASQFATSGAVDRLRSSAGRAVGGPALVLAATDPANPYGAALPWPERAIDANSGTGHQPGRKAGALVITTGGELVLYVERGGRTLLTWTRDPAALQSAADALALAVRDGALGKLTVEKADGVAVLGSAEPLAEALSNAGFHTTPRGLRLRR